MVIEINRIIIPNKKGNNFMDNTLHQLRARVASLESKIDVLESELVNLNEMLVRCGFPEGIHTLKETVLELLAEDATQKQNHQRPELI